MKKTLLSIRDRLAQSKIVAVFDALMSVTGGILVGSASVDALSYFFGLPDNDLTRAYGMLTGMIVAIAMIVAISRKPLPS